MKWLILIVVVILVAPTIAKRLETLNPDNPDKAAERRRGGLIYRSVRRFGPRKVFAAFVVLLIVLAIVAYLAFRRFV